ncbi:MAG: hypothetical protein E7334_05840 [Clostridiales bacterium]|nr:hypothetical protein [Clostridiales bacterium]MBQ2818118.1 hypothetical protein [Clostridia bacterium]
MTRTLNAAKEIEELKAKGDLSELFPYMFSPLPKVRALAYTAIACFPDESSAVCALISGMDDPDSEARQAAIDGIVNIGGRQIAKLTQWKLGSSKNKAIIRAVKPTLAR